MISPSLQNQRPNQIDLNKKRKRNSTLDVSNDDILKELKKEKKIPLRSIVKISCSITEQSYMSPWKMKNSFEVSGSGFLIGDRRVVTNAHVVNGATFITVFSHGSTKKYPARIHGIGHDCDLAILKVDEEEFWKDAVMFKFGKTPKLEHTVSVIGYPLGGDSICVTKGIVSRIEMIQYSLNLELLSVQIDAPINPGNSGGPVFNSDGQVVGVAFQKLEHSDNIGYIIPSLVVENFIKQIEVEGKYLGFVSLGIKTENIESPHLAEFLKLEEPEGVLVIKSSNLFDNQIKEGDILLEIDGKKISGNGSVEWRKMDRINYNHFITMKSAGEQTDLTICRENEVQSISIKSNIFPHVVPATHKAFPFYYVCGGFVFCSLTGPFFEEFIKTASECPSLSHLEKLVYSGEYCHYENHEIVVLSRILKDELNFGYESLEGTILKKLNGTPVKNLRHLKELVESAKDFFIVYEFDENKKVALKKNVVEQRNESILKVHKIPSNSNLI
eukprot:TRINITY_DN1930_c0_g1_i1.p1 TRINITY_DN1930_c0_g1~~TRINITY_DN1930_c0_g1_i1.p1  ORF type:complete len:500 (-),score=149.83 TRINITY_DN1930_c0_g1_i1:18-1517(-)